MANRKPLWLEADPSSSNFLKIHLISQPGDRLDGVVNWSDFTATNTAIIRDGNSDPQTIGFTSRTVLGMGAAGNLRALTDSELRIMLGTGSPIGTMYLEGNGQWSVPPGGSTTLAALTDVVVSGPPTLPARHYLRTSDSAGSFENSALFIVDDTNPTLGSTLNLANHPIYQSTTDQPVVIRSNDSVNPGDERQLVVGQTELTYTRVSETPRNVLRTDETTRAAALNRVPTYTGTGGDVQPSLILASGLALDGDGGNISIDGIDITVQDANLNGHVGSGSPHANHATLEADRVIDTTPLASKIPLNQIADASGRTGSNFLADNGEWLPPPGTTAGEANTIVESSALGVGLFRDKQSQNLHLKTLTVETNSQAVMGIADVGGALGDEVVFNYSHATATEELTPVAGDMLLIQELSGSAFKRVPWSSLPAGGGGVSNIDDLGDVQIFNPGTSEITGDYLRWNGTAWADDGLAIVDDTTPELGGNLVVGTSNIERAETTAPLLIQHTGAGASAGVKLQTTDILGLVELSANSGGAVFRVQDGAVTPLNYNDGSADHVVLHAQSPVDNSIVTYNGVNGSADALSDLNAIGGILSTRTTNAPIKLQPDGTGNVELGVGSGVVDITGSAPEITTSIDADLIVRATGAGRDINLITNTGVVNVDGVPVSTFSKPGTTSTVSPVHTVPIWSDGAATGFLDSRITINSTGTPEISTTGLNDLNITSGGTLSLNGQEVLASTITAEASGDILYRASSPAEWVNLPKGTNGEVLTLAAGFPSWAAAGGGGGSADLRGLTDVDPALGYVQGNIMYWDSVLDYTALATGGSGNEGYFMRIDSGGDPSWFQSDGLDQIASSASTRGNMIVGKTASNNWAALVKGTSGQYLRADGTDTLWAGLNIADDATPQLGAPLDVDGNAIVSVSAGHISLTPDGVGETRISNLRAYDRDATGAGLISPEGAASNIDLNLTGKGTGAVQVNGTDILDVSVTAPATNHAIQYVGGSWVNQVFDYDAQMQVVDTFKLTVGGTAAANEIVEYVAASVQAAGAQLKITQGDASTAVTISGDTNTSDIRLFHTAGGGAGANLILGGGAPVIKTNGTGIPLVLEPGSSQSLEVTRPVSLTGTGAAAQLTTSTDHLLISPTAGKDVQVSTGAGHITATATTGNITLDASGAAANITLDTGTGDVLIEGNQAVTMLSGSTAPTITDGSVRWFNTTAGHNQWYMYDTSRSKWLSEVGITLEFGGAGSISVGGYLTSQNGGQNPALGIGEGCSLLLDYTVIGVESNSGTAVAAGADAEFELVTTPATSVGTTTTVTGGRAIYGTSASFVDMTMNADIAGETSGPFKVYVEVVGQTAQQHAHARYHLRRYAS